MADVFISYSRRDKEFVGVLYDALLASQYDTWVDWQDIAPTTEWWQEIEAGIEAAHTFIFVISQDSIASKYCRKEIDHALQHGKRLIPVLRRKDYIKEEVHPKLGQRQWIAFQAEDDFDAAFATLVEAINTDLEHKKTHTRLEVRAIEWGQSQRDASLLLRGSELNKAQQWLLQASGGKEPRPTELQASYIAASRERTTQEQERTTRRQRMTVGALSGLLLLASGAGTWAWLQQQKALKGEINANVLADSLAMEAYLQNGLEEEAVIQAVRTGQDLEGKDANRINPDIRFRAIASIREVVYGVKERDRLIGHSDGVISVAFSPDGETIATASGDQTVKLWNRQGEELQTLKGHGRWVISVAFSPDGETIATASNDQTVKLWNRQGEELQTLKGHSDGVNSVAFSPDGETIATASRDRTVKLWNRQGEELQTLQGHKAWVLGVAFSPDGNTLATASRDRTVKLWSRDGKELQTLQGHGNGVSNVAFSPNGEILASASWDNTVKLWSKSGEELQTLKGHSNSVSSVAFSPDGETIATASEDSTVKLWSKDGEELQSPKGHSDIIYDVAFSPDGQTFATVSEDNTAKLWSKDGKELQTLKGHSGAVLSVAFSPDGATIATASEDNTVKLWSKNGKEIQQPLKGNKASVNDVAFSPDGETLATASEDSTVKLWSKDGEELQTLRGHSDGVLSVTFSPDGETLATASKDSTVKLWSKDGEELQTLQGHKTWVSGVAFSPNGETLVSASWDNTLKLWNKDGEELQTLRGHGDGVLSVTFSPDSEILATASEDSTVKLWSKYGEELQTLKGHSGRVYGVAFSPDGEILASASADKTVKLWDFRLDNLTARGCDWLSTYFVKQSPELLAELEVCQQHNPDLMPAAAPMLVTQAENLARNGNTTQAIKLFDQAMAWDTKLDIDSKTKARNLATAQALVNEAGDLAQAGQLAEATAKFTEAKQLDPGLDFEPETYTKELAVQGYLDEGNQFLNEGNVQDAIQAYRQADALGLEDGISAYDWNKLCWGSSTYNDAKAVMFACEKAIALAPGDSFFLDSRGLARALIGDTQGAISDFKAYVEWTSNEEGKAERQAWIAALERGENPFTPEVLESLR